MHQTIVMIQQPQQDVSKHAPIANFGNGHGTDEKYSSLLVSSDKGKPKINKTLATVVP